MATATLANTRLSLVNGTAFADFSESGTLTPFLGQRLTVYDSAGKKVIGYIKAAGTGETLGTEKASSWTNDGFDTYTTTGSTVNSAIEAGTDGNAYTNLLGLSTAMLVKASFNLTKNSGAYPYFKLFTTATGSESTGKTISTKLTSDGVRSYYGVSVDSTTNDTCAFRGGLATDFAVASFSVKQVLTPSATGVTITSTPGGTTYNWESIETGFNYNDASGYSFYVTTSSSGIYKRRMRLLKR